MLFFVVISLLGSVISQNHFPGEDYLKHGFDALTMQPTTGVIFDTSNSASSLVTFNGKKYKLSNYLSVTTIDTFYEYYNQNVHSTYDSYWRDYTSSYHFSAGPVVIGDLTISANYDRTLHDVQNITSTSDSSISISRGYWFQAAVGFSTVIDSVPKAQSFKDAWKNVPINPITDADYVKYCNLFDAYGQFYHSKLIIGGRFVINTIVSSEYLSKTSASTVSEQMSINARYTVAKMSANTDESEYEQQLSEEFKSSSYTDVYWLPYPPSGTWANESEAIDEWKEYAYANPGVTNSTLNPICDLLRTDNELYPWADTCKELSDYLLTNGKCKRLSLEIPLPLPTSSMNNKEPQLKSPSPHILAPGLDTVGALYDITTMTIGPVVVNQSTPGPWIPFCLPAYPEYCYLFPPYYYPVDSSSANVMNSSFITTRTVDFYTQTSYTTTDDSDGILGFGSESSSTTTTKLDTFLYQQTYELNVLMRQFHWLNVQLITFPPPPFTDVFQANYNNLRMKGQTYDAWKEIFQQLGTHLIIGAEMGGVVMALEFYQTCLLEKHSTEWIQTQITKKYDPLGVFSSNEVTSTTTATVEKDYEVNSVASFTKHGGSDDIPVEEWDKWQYTVKDRPLPIHLTLIPLCLFVPADLKQSCDASLHEYRQTAENQREADISYMEKLRPNPPTTC